MSEIPISVNTAKYRTAGGRCNNLPIPLSGKSQISFEMFMFLFNEDGRLKVY